MLFYQTVFAALLIGAAAAIPTTLQPSQLQSTELEKREQKITWSICTSCIKSDCTSRSFMHWGDNKLGSCNDKAFPYFDDECKTLGYTIPTPSGDGSWALASCSAGTDQHLGDINVSGKKYTCYRANNKGFSNFCGTSWYCHVYASCYGP